jgi:cytochrome b
MTAQASSRRVRVWDLGVRLFHWSLVAGFAAAYLTEDFRDLHKAIGYAAAGLVGFRVFWGFAGTRHARFSDFVPGPKRLFSYLGSMARGREPRYLGHNPAGGAMIVALLSVIAAITGTGVMMGMDAFFGADWVEDLHEAFVNLALVLIALHVGGVAYSSLRHRENLVRAMITGDKVADDSPPPEIWP